MTHTRPLTKVVYNAQGDLLFTASKDNSPNVWYSHNGERLGTYNGHNGSIWSLSVSNDSQRLASGSGDNTAREWDVSTGKVVEVHQTQTAVRSVAYSMGGKELLISTDARMGFKAQLIVFDQTQKDPVRQIELTGARPTVVLWADCNRIFVTAHDDGTLTKWDSAKLEQIQTSKPHTAAISDLQFSKCGTHFITASKDCTAKLIDLKTLDVIKTYRTERPVNSASISPLRDEVVLAGGQEAQQVTTTSTRAGKFEARFFNAMFEEEVGRVKGHFGPINTIAYHPRGIGFASGAEDGYVRIHEFDPDYFTFGGIINAA